MGGPLVSAKKIDSVNLLCPLESFVVATEAAAIRGLPNLEIPSEKALSLDSGTETPVETLSTSTWGMCQHRGTPKMVCCLLVSLLAKVRVPSKKPKKQKRTRKTNKQTNRHPCCSGRQAPAADRALFPVRRPGRLNGRSTNRFL